MVNGKWKVETEMENGIRKMENKKMKKWKWKTENEKRKLKNTNIALPQSKTWLNQFTNPQRHMYTPGAGGGFSY